MSPEHFKTIDCLTFDNKKKIKNEEIVNLPVAQHRNKARGLE